MARNRLRTRMLVALALAGSALGGPVAAQDSPEARLRKIEAEVRALQRKVFPGGASRFFEAEIAPPATTTGIGPAIPATSPLTDLIARLDGVERALARATAQAEENANRMNQLEARLGTLEAGQAAPGGALEPSGPPAPAGALGAIGAASSLPRDGSPGASERLLAVAAIEKPISGDPGEDEYLYGYRLWEARFFPEAQQQLKLAIERYPRHKRTSYSRNLLGRAYLDDGKPGTAAQVFLENYQTDKAGARASDSLLYLATAMTRLKENGRACVALAELADAYPAEVAGRLARQYAAAKAEVRCN